MQRVTKQKLLLAVGCILCVMLIWESTPGLEGTEFSGGRITGPILDMHDIGGLLFVLALAATFTFPRIASAIALTASLLCFPLYVYFTSPGPFRQVFRGEYSVRLQSNFVFARWAIAGMLAVAATACISVWTIAVARRKDGPPSVIISDRQPEK
jgi:hypothetical protein